MEDEVSTYREQLSQVQLEISKTNDPQKTADLRQLESDIQELIKLTEESSQPEGNLDDEYNLFRAELDLENDNKKEETEKVLNELQNDLDSLPGMKCQAPFKHAWCDEPVYHNALVFKVEQADNVENAEDIHVCVMFTNPTEMDMKPCPYFLEGSCRFTNDKCRFSHGSVVPLNSLKEYKEPDFSLLSEGRKILVKNNDGLWFRGFVESVNDDKCVVKLESNSSTKEVDFQDVFPLDGEESDSESDDEEDDVGRDSLEVLRSMPASCALGSWEQYTTGFGSKMMAKMGYVHGTGLGANGEGRVEPVPAVVYPSGKSLDHCMMLKEKAGGDKDMFAAERKMRKSQRKHEEAMKKAYEKEKQRTDVFSFMNNRLGQNVPATPDPGTATKTRKQLQSTSRKGLNVSSLQIAEDVKKIEKEKRKLEEGLNRHSLTSPAYTTLKGKIKECEMKLSQLEASERKISAELQQRNDRKKLSIF